MDLGNVSVPNVGMLALRGNPVTPGSLTHPIPPVQGLGILPIDNEEAYSLPPDSTPGLHQPQQILGQRPSVPKTVDEMDDDFYFDDGLIDEVNSDDNEEKFDESVLDDPTHPLYERKPKRFSLSDNPVPARTNSATLEQPRSSLVSKSSHLDGERTVYVASAPYPGPSANAEALDTFHSILAMAATKAAENGRFQRHDSFGADAAEKSSSLANLNDEGPQEQSSSRPSLVPDESRTSQATTMSPLQGSHMDDSNEAKALAKDQKVSGFSLPSDYHEDYMAYASDFSDYDSMLEEDPIIAAANAEALANDDDGFYGSEFGFYAKPG